MCFVGAACYKVGGLLTSTVENEVDGKAKWNLYHKISRTCTPRMKDTTTLSASTHARFCFCLDLFKMRRFTMEFIDGKDSNFLDYR